jgi:hypothetical protein
VKIRCNLVPVIAMLDQSRLELVEQLHRLFDQPRAGADSYQPTDGAPLILYDVLSLLDALIREIKICYRVRHAFAIRIGRSGSRHGRGFAALTAAH